MEWLHLYTQNLYNHEHELNSYRYEMSQMPGSQQLNPKATEKLQDKHPDLQKVRSIYLWGDPGCGKSFLMEQFYEALELKSKKFLHYQEFMLQIHETEHKVNKQLRGKSQDTIAAVGKTFCEDLLVFCIDEFQVLDIADAMILKRLFESFSAH